MDNKDVTDRKDKEKCPVCGESDQIEEVTGSGLEEYLAITCDLIRKSLSTLRVFKCRICETYF